MNKGYKDNYIITSIYLYAILNYSNEDACIVFLYITIDLLPKQLRTK